MKKSQFSIPWKEGLHLRPAAAIVKCAKRFESSILLRLNDRLADARSILAIMILAAGAGAVVSVEVNGVDEAEAYAAVSKIFETAEGDIVSNEFDVIDEKHPD